MSLLDLPLKPKNQSGPANSPRPVELAHRHALGGRLRDFVDTEAGVAKLIGASLACVLAFLWYGMMLLAWSPAHPGVDQNGYIVGGKMFADHLSTGMLPPNIYSFVGQMWIGTPWQTYYPKYPMGLPMIYAATLKIGQIPLGRALVYCLTNMRWLAAGLAVFLLARWLAAWLLRKIDFAASLGAFALAMLLPLCAVRVIVGPWHSLPIPGPSAGVSLAYLVNPIAMTLALLASFYLVRMVAGSVAGLMALVVIAASPVTMQLTDNPSSHATSLFFVAWGMYLLLRWWQHGGAWRAAVAGLLIGYAVTIRYTEGLLLLPVVLVAILNFRWNKRRLTETGLLLAWWGIPVILLLAFNLGSFGSPTGYDSTNESTGFNWQNFQKNWETTVRQLYNSGLFFLLPLSLAGLVAMFAFAWRTALMLTAWLLPSLILYTAYYWAPDSIGYARFYLTLFPAFAMTAFWMLGKALPAVIAAKSQSPTISAWRRGTALGTASLIALLGIAAAIFVVADMKWTRDNPLPVDTYQRALMPLPQQMRRAGVPIAVAAANKTAAEQWLKIEKEDDNARLANGGKTLLHQLPIAAGILAAVCLAAYGLTWLRQRDTAILWGHGRGFTSGVVACGLLGLCSAGMDFYASSADFPTYQISLIRCDQASQALIHDVYLGDKHFGIPLDSVIFSDIQMLHHLQFVGDFETYDLQEFTPQYVQRFAPERIQPDQPQGLQPERAQMLYRMLNKMSQKQLIAQQWKIVDDAVKSGRKVFLLVTDSARRSQVAVEDYFPPDRFVTVRKMYWFEPLPLRTRWPAPQRLQGLPPPRFAAVRATTANEAMRWAIYEVTPVPPPPPPPPPPIPPVPRRVIPATRPVKPATTPTTRPAMPATRPTTRLRPTVS